ncbi:MAG: HD domain-containing phosphohydrolase, partial [Coriobacteriales bacterium]
ANYTESGDRDLALTLGADLFLTKPMSQSDLVSALTEVVERVRREGHTRAPLDIPAEESFREHNVRLLPKMEQQLAELTAANERLHDLVVNTVLAIATLVEARDPYTAGHQERVALLAYTIAGVMDVPDDECDGIRLAGLVHDIGKIYVPLEILSRPSQLTAPEFEIIKMHPTVAYNALRGIDFPWPLAEWVHQHHERLDGSGYPQGLRGNQVLAGARILVVADVVEAMTNHRPYKPAVGIDAALAEVREGAGRLYDPAVAEACLALFDQGFTLPAAPAHPGAASVYQR